jgi:glutamate dehydrogenase
MTADRTIAEAYEATYRGPHPGAATNGNEASGLDVSVLPALIAAHRGLAQRRLVGETLVAVVAADDAGGFGPALQIVTDQATTLMDSVTVLLHRLGVAYVALMQPRLHVRRDSEGALLEVSAAGDGPGDSEPGVVDESWIHVQLAPSVNGKALTEVVRLLPMVIADARQVAQDSAALSAALQRLADDIDADAGVRFAGPDHADVAGLLRWLGDGNFVVLGAQRCTVSDGRAVADAA